MASSLRLHPSGAVGFIDWLDAALGVIGGGGKDFEENDSYETRP